MNYISPTEVNFKQKHTRDNLEIYMVKVEKEIKRFWNSLVAKWIGVNKKDPVIVKGQY